MDVFKAFPNAIDSGWSIGTVQRGTDIGDVYKLYGDLHVIVDSSSTGSLETAPNASTLAENILIYAKPSELPTLDVDTLISDYLLVDSNSRYYNITDAGIGKNQENGTIEHVELSLRQTEAV